MAKPRVFVSSTYYDLKHIRNNLESFIDSLGFDSVLFESGDIAFRHDQPIDESCYGEISSCHMLVLIIGGRYGSVTSDAKKLDEKELDKAYQQYNSITRKEYETARDRDIPVFIFVDSNVLAEYQTFKQNRDNKNINYAHVDSANVFFMLDDILSQRRNNFIRGFEKFDDISSWLRDQWAGLFAEFLSHKSQETTLKSLASQITDLAEINHALKDYTESILKTVVPDQSGVIISRQTARLTSNRVKRFAAEPMIHYVLKNGKPSITPERAFNALVNSTSVGEFLQKCHFSKAYITEFMEENEFFARLDFPDLQKRYSFADENDEVSTSANKKRKKDGDTREDHVKKV